MSANSQRIAWIVYGSLEQVSGGYIYDRLVVEHLRALGDMVTCISLEPGATALPRLSRADHDVVIGDELCFRELGPMFRAASPGLRRVLLMHHLTAWEHAAGREQRELLALEKAAIDAADAWVATSSVTADRLRRGGLLRDVQVAEPGADRLASCEVSIRAPRAARVRFLFIGNLLPRKRALELVRAFAKLPAARVELTLIGAPLDVEYAAKVRAAIEQPGIADRIRWLGQLDAQRVAEELAAADALVLPSALEGYGMVLSEALWSAVPIIAARVGAAEQLVDKTGAGLLFEPDDQAGLSAALGSFTSDPALRARLQDAASASRAVLPRWRDTALTIRAMLRSR